MLDQLRALHREIGATLAALDRLAPVVAAWRAVPGSGVEAPGRVTDAPGTITRPNGSATPAEPPAQAGKASARRRRARLAPAERRAKNAAYARERRARQRATEVEPEAEIQRPFRTETGRPEDPEVTRALAAAAALPWERNGEAPP